MANLMITPLYSPYFLLAVAVTLITCISLWTRLSERATLEYGTNTFLIWTLIGLVISWNVENYWLYLMHWLIAVTVFLGIWFVVMTVCEKFSRNTYHEGASMVLTPAFSMPHVVFLSLVGKGCIWAVALI